MTTALSAALSAVLLLAMLVALVLGWAGHKPAGWALWTAAQAGSLALDLATGGSPVWLVLDTVTLLFGAVVLADLQRKARA